MLECPLCNSKMLHSPEAHNQYYPDTNMKNNVYDEERARIMRLQCGCPICREIENNGYWMKPETLWQKFIKLFKTK